MSHIPNELKYSKSHEWARDDGDVITVGITDHAQELLGDLVFVELPEVGEEVTAGAEVAVVESVKAASDVYSPIGGVITEVNAVVIDDPALVNQDPYAEAWLFKIEPHSKAELDDLLDADEYAEIAEAH